MIEQSTRDGVAVLTMRHGKANALDLELIRELEEALSQVESSGAQAVVVTGQGSVFSAGVDLFRVVEGGADYLADFLPGLSRLLERLFDFPRPVVAAVNGHAIAGGCVITLACDYRVAASGARIGIPELKVGVPYPLLVVEIVRFAVPRRCFQDLAYRGKTFGGEEARERGLADELALPEEVLDRAVEVAAELAAIPPRSFTLSKRMMREPALERYRRRTGDLDPEVVATWQDPEILAAIGRYIEATFSKKG